MGQVGIHQRGNAAGQDQAWIDAEKPLSPHKKYIFDIENIFKTMSF
jgi:hypothetical protein